MNRNQLQYDNLNIFNIYDTREIINIYNKYFKKYLISLTH